MSENKDNKLTLINEKTANDYLTHTKPDFNLTIPVLTANIFLIKSLKNTSEPEPFYYRLMDTGENDEDKEVQERRD